MTRMVPLSLKTQTKDPPTRDAYGTSISLKTRLTKEPSPHDVDSTSISLKTRLTKKPFTIDVVFFSYHLMLIYLAVET